MADSKDGGISRKRLLIASVLLGVGVLIGAGLLGVGVQATGISSWQAEADPGFTPPHDCGSYNDSLTDPRNELWKSVKDATPQKPSPNIFVNESWALKDGGQGKYDLLAIPRARVTGVECADIWGPKAFNLWKPAWEEATNRLKGDVILGINSKPGRKQDQLHIHLTHLKSQARKQLDTLKPTPPGVSKWNTSMYSVMGHVYRIAKVDDLNTNVFQLVKENISHNDMFEQSIAVVAAPSGKGFYLLNTQGRPKEPGEPEHMPELHLNKDWGTESIEDLLERKY
jgi:CDP-diacylglycerol pyrophosphatase